MYEKTNKLMNDLKRKRMNECNKKLSSMKRSCNLVQASNMIIL